MSFLNDLANLIHHHSQPQAAPQHAAPQHPSSAPINLPLQGRTEDSGMVRSPQGYTPLNADVSHFPMRPQGMPEDSGLVNGQQGYAPLNADVAHFNRGIAMPNFQVQAPAHTYWQNTGGQRQNMVNPQVNDNGFFYN